MWCAGCGLKFEKVSFTGKDMVNRSKIVLFKSNNKFKKYKECINKSNELLSLKSLKRNI